MKSIRSHQGKAKRQARISHARGSQLSPEATRALFGLMARLEARLDRLEARDQRLKRILALRCNPFLYSSWCRLAGDKQTEGAA